METESDICISGGGMVGGTLAWALANAGYRVCLLEPQRFSADSIPELMNERSVALSYSSRVLLEHLGLWQDIKDQVCAIRHIHVSERGRLGASRLHADEEDVEALGYVVRNSIFLKTLYEKLDAVPGLTMRSGASLVSINRQVDRIEYFYSMEDKNESGSARLLIASDGSNSPVRKMMSIGETNTAYDQTAVIANVQCELEHKNTAYERFTDSGPLALLPLADKTMAMVYTINSEDTDSVVGLDDQEMLLKLQERFGFRLGRFEKIGERLAFPLALMQSDEQFNGRVLMMGNAARTLHPVSGQGFNLALRDIALLIEALTISGKLTDPGENALIRDFCQQRRSDQKSVVRFTDTLVRVFRGNAPVFSHLRASGLTALDLMPPVKHLLARQSMGLSNRLPNLAKLTSKIKERAL